MGTRCGHDGTTKIEIMMQRFALKYRPRTFAQIRGQDHPKQVVRQLILNSQSCANLLFHGSIGSGKTTFVRSYAMALNCDQPTELGDCCLVCSSCVAAVSEKASARPKYAVSESGLEELDAPRFRSLDLLKDRLDLLLETPIPAGKRRVLFADEPHVLSRYPDSFDYFLKIVEESPPNVSFCFATTALERISPALRSRTIQLEVRPLTLELSLDLLKEVSVNENLEIHPEALSLIVGLGEHQPRNMLQALEKTAVISNGAEITRDRVATIFGVDYIETLVRYFEALGSGSLEDETITFLQWPDSIRQKVRLIHLFLIALYYTDLCKLKVFIDPIIASIRSDERQRALNAFTRRLPAVDLKTFFEGLIGLWPAVTEDMSDEALLATVTRFQVAVNEGECIARAQPASRITPEAVPDTDRTGRLQRKAHLSFEDASVPKDPRYLTRSHVRSIFAAASYLVQQGHQPFNARITIRHRDFGHESQPEASRHFAKFSQALKGRLEHWGGSGLRVFVQERSEHDGSCGRVIAHIPKPTEAAQWFKKWHRSFRSGAAADEAITFELDPPSMRLDGHWRCVRWLCGGLNPNDPVRKFLNIEEEFDRVAGDVGQRTRVDSSEPLAAAARSQEEEECGGLSIASAFEDAQFQRLYDGWELDEHAYRRQERDRWQAAVADIKASHMLDGSTSAKETQEYELEELRRRHSWPARPWSTWSDL